MCTQCKEGRQILKFTLTTVPEPLFTQEEIPLLTHMFYFDGYIFGTTNSEIVVYDLATNKSVPQPSRSYIDNLPDFLPDPVIPDPVIPGPVIPGPVIPDPGPNISPFSVLDNIGLPDNIELINLIELKKQFFKGVFQGVVAYRDTLYLKKSDTMMGFNFGDTILEIPFDKGVLDYTRMKIPNITENIVLQFLSQLFNISPVDTFGTPLAQILYDNIKIQIKTPTPDSLEEIFEIRFGKTLIQEKNLLLGIVEDLYSSYISFSDNLPVLPIYLIDPTSNLAYIVSTDTISCKEAGPGPGPGPDDFIGTICFLSGSMVLTDQGPIAIEFIVPYVHTVSNKTIIGISITYSCEDTLVCIERNSISKFVPNKDTFLSNNHKIYYKGKFLEAAQFLGRGFRGIYTIPYENQLLYNVILKEHDIMNVNNLICETLDPSNPIAKEFISVFRE
jgi:hypothetical protein